MVKNTQQLFNSLVANINLPIEVILNVLCQVYVKDNKVVEVTPTEGVPGSLVGQAAAPLTDTAHGIQ